MWDIFCTWVQETYSESDIVRSAYDNAISNIGRDYFAGPIWQKYLEWVVSLN